MQSNKGIHGLQISGPDAPNGEMVRHTGTVTCEHAIITDETHKEYRGPSSLYIESQDSLVAHGPIVLRRPGNGREAPIVKRQKCNPEKSYKVLKI
jgi:hypothetical protein